MTYENRRVNDRQMLEILVTARRLGITCMVHAENDDMVNLCVPPLLCCAVSAGLATLSFGLPSC